MIEIVFRDDSEYCNLRGNLLHRVSFRSRGNARKEARFNKFQTSVLCFTIEPLIAKTTSRVHDPIVKIISRFILTLTRPTRQ